LPEISFPVFRATAEIHLRNYLKRAWAQTEAGIARIPPGLACLFPRTLIFTETPTHYAFELFGARRQYRGIKTKRATAKSFDIFLGDFSYDGPTKRVISFKRINSPSAQPIIFQNLALVHQRTLTELDNRFPGVNSLFGTKILYADPGDAECIKSFDAPNLSSSLLVGNCLIANTLGSLVRARYTNLLFALPRGVTESEFRDVLNEYIPSNLFPHPGVQVVRAGQQESIAQAGRKYSEFV
jgi:hypothetical protein